MALRGKKKLPEKRGFVDGPGGYRGIGGYGGGDEGPASGGNNNDGGSNNDGGGNNNDGGGNNNVSPGQSMAMLGTTELAGLSQEQANTALGDIARAGYLGFGDNDEPVLDGDGNPVTTPGALQNVMDRINNQTDITEPTGFTMSNTSFTEDRATVAFTISEVTNKSIYNGTMSAHTSPWPEDVYSVYDVDFGQ